MNKEKENNLVPRLRFPEFEKDGPWIRTRIGDVGEFYYGKSAPKWSLSENAPTLCVRYGELYTKFDTIISDISSRTNIDPQELKFSKGGEILVPRVGEVPRDFAENVCYLPFPNIAIGEMISVYNTKEYPIFYTHYFRTLWREFAKVVEGQNVKNLYYINLEPIPVGKPSYNEQQKIADCLSSLDDLISVETEKLAALKEHKKGLMQQLFPAEGEKFPKLRFPEFKDSGEWEERPIDKIFKIFQGYAFSSSHATNNGIRWIKIADVGIQEMKKNNVSYLPSGFKDKYSNFLVKKGDYLIALTRPILDKKLKIAKIDEFSDNALLNQRVGKLLSDENSLDFIYYLLQTDRLVEIIEKNIAGNEPPNLSSQQIGNILSYIPKNNEQQKIADCLSSLDEQIAVQAQKIDDLKLHKKGLMQSLFPTNN